MNKYINLINHSNYSLLQSSLTLEQIVNFSIENNSEYASLIDIDVMYGSIEFYNLCKSKKIKPIIGLQTKFENNQLVFIAKNYEGYKSLLLISSKIMTKNNLTKNDIFNDNFFIVRLSGDITFNSSNFFIADNITAQNSIACHESFYLNEEEYKIYKILDAIKLEKTIEINSKSSSNLLNKLFSESEFEKKYNLTQLNNLKNVINEINLVFPEIKENNIIKYKNDFNLSSKDFLYKLTTENLSNYLNLNPKLNKQEYLDRLNFELEIITNKKFEDYFLVVYDFVNWAKRNNIMIGPGRGSAAGSLVSFCLNITEIDPIKYNLLFERFLNVERITMPDIDIDVMDNKREELIEYLFDKYGYNHVCHIITFSRMKAKQAIRDVGRVLGINLDIINKICKNIKPEFELDLIGSILNPNNFNFKLSKNLEFLKKEFHSNEQLFYFSQKLIGLPRQTGMHAAGIILSNSKITDFTPIQSTTNNKIMTQFSMEYLESLNLIKFDILGLRNLTIIQNIIKLIYHTRNKTINLKEIDLNDQNVFSLFQKGNTNGIFQFESTGMKNTLKSVIPNNIEDLSIVSAIYRPGANESINLYIKNKNSISQNYLNNEIKDVLSSTHGIIIYQEQIIKLVQIIAKFDKFKSDNFRKAISKKKEELILQNKNEFISGALNNGYSEKDANELFENMLKFVSYGFNHSHSLAYSFISYWLAYLKYYYPIESISVFLTYGDSDEDKLKSYIKEAKDFKVKILGPDINLSSISFTLWNSKLFFSFLSIPGLGLESAKKIIDIRNLEKSKKFEDPLLAIAKLSSNGISKTILINLIKVGAFDSLNSNRDLLLGNIEFLTNKKTNIITDDKFRFSGINLDIPENKNMKAIYEIEVLGISFSETLIQKLNLRYKDKYKLLNFNEINQNKYFSSLFKIKEITKKNTKEKNEYLSLKIINDDKEYLINAFDNIENLISILKLEDFYIGKFKLSKDMKNINLQEIIEKVNVNNE